jgi:ParB/RepB/Spo0J family partition protein
MQGQYANDHIHNNPWQTRQLDPARVEQIEQSIRANDLMHPPVGRPHPSIPGDVQLAMGHHRRAAWFRAHPGEPLTIDVRDLTDQQMAKYAIVENNDRADLTAIEKAEALKRYMEDFGVKQEEAGQLFGLKTQGAVSNLLRLLQLPAPVQDLVREGKLPERHARVLLVASKMDSKKAVAIAKQAAAKPADEVDEFLADEVGGSLGRGGREIDTDLIDIDKQTAFVDHPDKDRPACRACPHFLRSSNDLYCGKPECYDGKVQRELDFLASSWSAKHHIPVKKPGEKASDIDVDYSNQSTLHRAVVQRLSVLRVRVTGNGDYSNRNVTGSEYIGLATTDRAALDRFLRSGGDRGAELKAKASQGKKLTPKEEKALKAAEEKARAARAAERSLSIRTNYDIAWLIDTASVWMGEGMKVSGGSAVFFHRYVSDRAYTYSDWETARAFLKRTEKEYRAKPDEANRKRHIAAMLITDNHLRGHDGHVNGHQFGSVAKRIARLANEFGIRPPKKWKNPPVHCTVHNCWKCGVFGTQPDRLTKGELAAGWTVKLKGAKVLDVRCPDCGKDVRGNA